MEGRKRTLFSGYTKHAIGLRRPVSGMWAQCNYLNTTMFEIVRSFSVEGCGGVADDPGVLTLAAGKATASPFPVAQVDDLKKRLAEVLATGGFFFFSQSPFAAGSVDFGARSGLKAWRLRTRRSCWTRGVAASAWRLPFVLSCQSCLNRL